MTYEAPELIAMTGRWFFCGVVAFLEYMFSNLVHTM
jgi:hypothetical protein